MPDRPENPICPVHQKKASTAYARGYKCRCEVCKGYNKAYHSWRRGAMPEHYKKMEAKSYQKNKVQQLARDKEYRKKNNKVINERRKTKYWNDPEKYRKQKNADYLKHKETRLKSCKEYYENNKEKLYKASRAWVEANKEEVAAYHRQYKIDNEEHIKERRKKYYRDNRHECIARANLRREKHLSDMNKLSEEDFNTVVELYKRADELRAEGKTVHVDHVMPVSKGGKTTPNNLAIITAGENMYKGDREPYLCVVPLGGIYRN